MKTAIIRIDGMTCNGCASSVTRALEALPVANVRVSVEDKRAELEYDERRITLADVIAAVENAGFDAHA